MQIRPERAGDESAIHAVNRAAFPGPQEAALVDALRKTDAFLPELSLVAEAGDRIIGHILFTRVSIQGTPALALAPMAVLPDHQRGGVGSALVRDGLTRATEHGERLVVVLGHPEYYPRFGFTPAGVRGLRIQWEAPPEAFLVKELVPGALNGVAGHVTYAAPFSEL